MKASLMARVSNREKNIWIQTKDRSSRKNQIGNEFPQIERLALCTAGASVPKQYFRQRKYRILASDFFKHRRHSKIILGFFRDSGEFQFTVIFRWKQLHRNWISFNMSFQKQFANVMLIEMHSINEKLIKYYLFLICNFKKSQKSINYTKKNIPQSKA